MDTSRVIFCEECHGTDFQLQHGLYYCTGCNTQSQEHGADVIVDEESMGVFDASSASFLTRRSFKKRSRKSKQSKLEEKSEICTVKFTSLDVFSALLVTWVDELEELGASSTLRELTLALWAKLLSVRQVAFLKKGQIPIMPANAFSRDQQVLLTGRCNPFKAIQISNYLKKKTMSAKDKRDLQLLQEDVQDNDESKEARRIRSRKRKRFLQVATNETVPANDTSESDTSFMSRVSFLSDSSAFESEGGNVSGNDDLDRSSSLNLDQSVSGNGRSESLISSTVKNRIKDIEWELDSTNPKNVAQIAMLKNAIKPIKQKNLVAFQRLRITLQDTFAIFNLAVLLNQENDITLAEILHWQQTNAISLKTTLNKIPRQYKLSDNHIGAFTHVVEANYDRLSKQIGFLGKHLELEEMDLDCCGVTNKALDRFILDFSLPKKLSDVLLRSTTELTWIKSNFSFDSGAFQDGHLPFPEVKALALLLFGLKYLYGMDDVTERIRSNNAKKRNQGLAFGSEGFFDIGEWMKLSRKRAFLMCRHSHQLHERLKALFPRTVLSPEAEVDFHHNIATMDDLNARGKLFHDKYNSGLRAEMKEFVKEEGGAKCVPSKSKKSKGRIDVKTSRNPLYDASQQILETDSGPFAEKEKENIRKLLLMHQSKFSKRTTASNDSEVSLDSEWDFGYLMSNESTDGSSLKSPLFLKRSLIKKDDESTEEEKIFNAEYWMLANSQASKNLALNLFFKQNLRALLPESFLWVLEYFAAVSQVPESHIYLHLAALEEEFFKCATELTLSRADKGATVKERLEGEVRRISSTPVFGTLVNGIKLDRTGRRKKQAGAEQTVLSGNIKICDKVKEKFVVDENLTHCQLGLKRPESFDVKRKNVLYAIQCAVKSNETVMAKKD